MSGTLPPDRLRRWLEALFAAMGAPPATARAVAESLLEAELAGHESHGLIRVTEYAQAVRDGHVDPAAQPQVLAENATQVHLDCQRAFGAYAAGVLTDRLGARAREMGVAAGALKGAGHVGRAGDYPARLARQGLAAFAFVNGGGTVPRVAPHGGRQAFLGTNPVAFAVPGPVLDEPIVVDFSTAAVASGKIRVLQQRGESLPAGWILDAQGRPSQAAADYYAGGMLVTAAGHKGYGLSLIVDVLAGLVGGTGCPGLPEGFGGGNGLFMVACNLDLFLPAEALRAQVRLWAQALRSIPPLDPAHPVVLAGEPEWSERARRTGDGLLLTPRLAEQLAEVGSAWQVGPP